MQTSAMLHEWEKGKGKAEAEAQSATRQMQTTNYSRTMQVRTVRQPVNCNQLNPTSARATRAPWSKRNGKRRRR